MIRLFLEVCRTYHKIKNLDEHSVCFLMEDLCSSMISECPSCHAPFSSFRRNGSYKRHLVCYHDGHVCDQLIRVRSVLCSSCNSSHALLISVIIPYSSYSLGFLISLLYARLTRKFPSVLSLCAHFDISESTYYRIKKRFVLDSKEFMAALHAFAQDAGTAKLSFPSAPPPCTVLSPPFSAPQGIPSSSPASGSARRYTSAPSLPDTVRYPDSTLGQCQVLSCIQEVILI